MFCMLKLSRYIVTLINDSKKTNVLECMHFVQLSENPEIFKLKVFSMIMVEKPETAGCLLQFLEMHSGVGRSLARNHISICFFLTFQLTKAEELHTLCIEKPELTKTEFLKLLQCWVAEVGGTWDQRSPKAYGICERKEIL